MFVKNRVEILEEHFKILAEAGKKQCSGEELKAITEALILTANYLDRT